MLLSVDLNCKASVKTIWTDHQREMPNIGKENNITICVYKTVQMVDELRGLLHCDLTKVSLTVI